MPAGNPRTSSARRIEKWAWSLTYTRTPSRAAPRGGVPAVPRRAARCTSRATVIAIRFAITPPEVRMPQPSGPMPQSSRSHDVTSSSTNAPIGPACQTSTPWCSHWLSTSPTIEAGSGGGVK